MVIAESSVADESELIARFDEEYRLGQAPVMREIEREVCGCDYGGTSWTTRDEARRAGDWLQLGSGKRLLEVGAGTGWPGLYLAATTGCDVTLLDLPLEGLRIAAERAACDGLAGTCWPIAGDGTALPFKDGCFDAVIHSDVLCCLRQKPSVLKECRRVLRSGGRMVFTVISIAPDLAPGDYARATAFGPPYIETTLPYPAMLGQTGWQIADRIDLSRQYGDSVRRLLAEEKARGVALRALLGDVEYSERLARRGRALRAIEAGLLRREMFGAV